jgi:putative oxidoreductase
MSLGLLLARLIIGLGLAAHGSQKVLGWFGGYGLKGTGGFFETIGFRPGALFSLLAGLSEIAGGLLVALGLLGPVGPAFIVMVMIVAAGSVHLKNGYFTEKQGIELNMVYIAAALAFAGGAWGKYSLDGMLHLAGFWTHRLDALVIAIGALIGAINLCLRRTTPPQSDNQQQPAG